MEFVETRVGMPLDEFIEKSSRERFELLDREKVALMPNVFDHIRLVKLIYDLIYEYLREHKIGDVFSESTFVLPDANDSNWVKGSRIPDVMFVSRETMQTFLDSPFARENRPFAVVPDLAVEIVSPTDKYTDVTAKSVLYLRDGVRLVWVFDYADKRVQVLHADGTNHYLSVDDTLSGGDVLPGFEAPLSALFQ